MPRSKDQEVRKEFEALLLPCLDACYRFALHLAAEPQEAEDLVQEAVLRAFRFYHQFRPGTNFQAWLFTIIRHTFINRYRARAAQSQARLWEEIDGEEVELELEADRADTPEVRFEQSWLRDHLATALKSLPKLYQMVVVLVDVEGLSYKETAQVLDVPIGTVMSRLYRGRSLLRQELSQHLGT
ncbi:MAG: sigma-70 family RNA polymerase sigma factor [Chloroflexi bacterium]|nr:sigma-70 family RNA polymerase sigma factor [Chloroflexota bacterium]